MIKKFLAGLGILIVTSFLFTGCSIEDDITEDKFNITIDEDQTTYINLLSGISSRDQNSTGTTGSASLYKLVDDADHGTISISGDILMYEPDADFFGKDYVELEQGAEDTIDYRLIKISIEVLSQPEGNKEPVISGHPTTVIGVNTNYSFTPTVVDKDDTSFTFSIANKPSWASFNTHNGQLSGKTPSYGHVYPDILISVTDGENIAELPLFSITVEKENNEPTNTDTNTTTN